MSQNSMICAVGYLGSLLLAAALASGEEAVTVQPDLRADVPPVVTAVAIDPQGRCLATGGDDHLIRIWDLDGGDLVRILAGHDDWVNGVAFSADGRHLFSAGSDGVLARWDVDQGTFTPLRRQQQAVHSLAWIADRQQLLTVGYCCPLRRIGFPGTTAEQTLDCPSRDMRIVVSSPDGSQFAAGGRDGRIRVWSSSDGSILHQLRAHDQRLRALAYSADGGNLISAGEDRAICVWDTTTGREVCHLDRPEGRILSLSILGAQRLAAGTSRNVIELWDFSQRKCIGTLTGHTGSVSALARHRDCLVSGGYDAQVRIWRVVAHGDAVATRVLDAGARTISR